MQSTTVTIDATQFDTIIDLLTSSQNYIIRIGELQNLLVQFVIFSVIVYGIIKMLWNFMLPIAED